uniref:Cleft lip and palate associated transmembrane protein 1 n=1 Tax=Heterorhabditis bacteriophora TaxID=37862 RepID=A0A1I7X2U2_HETBA
MVDAVLPAETPAVGEQAQGGGAWAAIKGMATRMIMIYFVTSMIKNATSRSTFPPSRNLFSPGEIFDIYLYLDESEQRFTNFEHGYLFWQEFGIRYGDWTGGPKKDGIFVFHKTIPTPDVLLRNQSIFLHVFVTKAGNSPNPKDRSHIKREVISFVIYDVRRLNTFKKKHYKKTANLLTGKSEQSDEDLKKAEQMTFEVLNFWHPNITINLVDDQTQWTKGSLPSPLDEAIKFDSVGGFYMPILFFNNYWNLGSEYIPINETVKEINLTISYQPLSLFKYQLYASQQMRSKWSSMLGGDSFEEDDDQDTIKQALLETNPILLAVTVIVSLLHTVFEFLAFKNDIQFWRSRKDLVGLSVRSVLFNIFQKLFQSLIVFLYICDNDTNWVVKMSVGSYLTDFSAHSHELTESKEQTSEQLAVEISTESSEKKENENETKKDK